MGTFGVIKMISLKNRIYIQNAVIIITLLILLETIFIIFIKTYYVESAKRELSSKLSFSATLYNKYINKESEEEKICYILENESKNQPFYVELLDKNFHLLIDSNGFSNDAPISYEDVVLAAKNKPEIIQRNDYETTLSMSLPLYDTNNEVWAYIRYSTCIDNIEENINYIIKFSILIISMALLASFLFSSLLVKKILVPIEKIILIAKKMATGDFSQRIVIKDKNELGTLGNTLNYMADEITKNEQLKNEFISSISHELRTPLTAIKGWSELIITGELDNTEDAKEGISIIAKETDRLSMLVEDLLDFSKLESRKIKLDLKETCINDLIKDISVFFKTKLEQAHIKLDIALPDEEMFILADSNRLKQIFINLIHNSMKFSNPNTTIRIVAKSENNFVLIYVIDEGIGISKEDLPKVTDKFFKGSLTQAGSGIGLAVCKEIMNLHSGQLVIDSIENIGTKVCLKFKKIS
ncbi:two-component sensor histidine kinase [Clostridiaceae bacterium 14S0207]|nr:two-component sensor histidine kinase [Clostridiaceae bacterium 14S0207]